MKGYQTAEEYWDDVISIARELCEDNEYDYGRIMDSLHDAIDGTGWMVWDDARLAVLRFTRNDTTDSWKDAETIEQAIGCAAFKCMDGDVMEEITDIIKKHKEE